MGQGGGPKDRLAEPYATARLRSFAEALGGGENVFVAGPEQKDEPKDYERLCPSAEAFVYAAMIRLMVRRLARAYEFPNSFSTHSAE